jgi:hypothetical protein
MAHTRYELRLHAPIARTVLEVIRTRFDHVTTPGADGTVLIIEDIDQASVRALLTLLWDTGHQVRSFEQINNEQSIP